MKRLIPMFVMILAIAATTLAAPLSARGTCCCQNAAPTCCCGDNCPCCTH
jgi:hypothetical protein